MLPFSKKGGNTMRYNLYLLQFNNYYNRQLKKFSTLEEYLDYKVAVIMDCNIDIKDAINTRIIINYKEELSTPNYLLLEDKVLNKITKWFVIECTMTRGLQYSLTIRRDVIADYFDTILKSPCIIQKGYVNNNNVLVFNQENQVYNKKKTKELLIKDNTGIGYVVGFIARDSNYAGVIKTTYTDDIQIDFDYNSLSQSRKDNMAIGAATPNAYITDRTMQYLTLNNMETQITSYYSTALQPNITKVGYYYNNGPLRIFANMQNSDYNASFNDNPTSLTANTKVTGSKNLGTSLVVLPSAISIMSPIYNYISQKMSSNLENYRPRNDKDAWRVPLDIDRYAVRDLQYYNGKITKINNVYYKAEYIEVPDGVGTKINDNLSLGRDVRLSFPTNSDLLNISGYSNLGINYENFNADTDISIAYNQYKCYIKLTPFNQKVYTNLTTSANRTHLIDNPYDMFVIPYSDDYQYEVNAQTYTANKNMAINLAQAICEASGSATYDIQIVPYCPFSIENDDWSLINSEPIYLDVGGDNDTSNDIITGYYFWAQKSSLTFTIEESREELTLSNDPSYKEITQLNKYILCSPDKNSQWEFNPAMNMGITEWNISLDYRPFSSYVKVQPTWNYLYGDATYNNMSDYRGLIFNGSYSLTQLNDAWANYLNGNKNYQQIFDTNINTELTKFNMNQAAQWDTVGLRNFSFNPVKAVLGIIGEDKQMEFDKKVFDVDLAAQRKLFDYQLDNIQNQPDTIKKLTSINIDFRIFPFVEIYEPTDSEKEIFRDNIRYNGMTIMATGYIENYLKPNDETFIKATLIRFNEFEPLENDYTLVQNINFELDKGIYITKEE